MKKAMSYAKEFFHRADIFLLVMGLICAIFGIVVISSATASYHSAKYVIVQSASLILGIFAFVVMTVLDVDVLADKWQILCAFNVVFLLLLIPFGVSDNTGNTGWLRFFGIGIQPTEVVKLTFIVVLAKQISYLKEYHDLNSVWSVAQLAGHFEKRGGMSVSACDAYINVIGGLELDEPAADLATLLAIASSFRDLPLGRDLAAVGEVGLSGEIRSVSNLNSRLSEIARLGFKRCVIPAHVKDDIRKPDGLELISVKDIREAIKATLG